MGKVAGGIRGWVGRVPEDQPVVVELVWVASGESLSGRLVGLSVDGGKSCV